MLADAEVSDIQLHRIGFSTVGLDRKRKEELYEIYFWFILDDLRKMHDSNPQDNTISKQLEWMEENYKEMKVAFKKPGFFFTLGFMLYSGRCPE